jgi:hypothetical protein
MRAIFAGQTCTLNQGARNTCQSSATSARRCQKNRLLFAVASVGRSSTINQLYQQTVRCDIVRHHGSPHPSISRRTSEDSKSNACGTFYEVGSEASIRSCLFSRYPCRDVCSLVLGRGHLCSFSRRAFYNWLFPGPMSSMRSGVVAWRGHHHCFWWLVCTGRRDRVICLPQVSLGYRTWDERLRPERCRLMRVSAVRGRD